MNYDYILFDLDGTITDSFHGLKYSISYMMDKLGYEMPCDDEFRKFIGPPILESFEHVLHIRKEDYDIAAHTYRTHFGDEGYKHFRVYPGIRNVLRSLNKAGKKVAVATSKPIEPTMKLLRFFGIADYFDTINAPENDEIINSKEYAISKALKFPHKKALMIGDRHFDANGAKKFGLDFMGASYGFGSERELVEAGAKYIVHSPHEILNVLNVDCEKGKFISFEGMDGSGKSTQLKILIEKLEQYGFDFINTREPGGTEISEEIRGILLSCDNNEMNDRTEALLFAASRAQHVEEKIKPNLNIGKHVICDRFVDSSIAYQGGGKKLGVDKVTAINEFAIDGLYPYKTIFFDMPVEKAIKRREATGNLDRLELEKIDFFKRTSEVYNDIKKKDSERYVCINADDSIDNIATNLFKCVAGILEPEIDWENCKYE